ncbi:MAG: glycosyltransferase, partial [Clostridiales bacterium]|nr:glycosyltransferase [Clostridiales bacterium]
MRILFAGGGTAGHINPAVAVAKYIKKQLPESEILFVGTERGLEKELVPKEGFAIRYIDVLGFKRGISPQNLTAAAKVLGAYGQSVKILREFQPDVVMGTGGYVSGPVLAAAAREKIPTLIHEQNVFPGFTSKILSGMVDVVCISFAQSKGSFKNAK